MSSDPGVLVGDLKPGDVIDLADDVYANSCEHGENCETDDCPQALGDVYDYAYAVVVEVEQETPTCVRVDFEHESAEISIGFPIDHILFVHGTT